MITRWQHMIVIVYVGKKYWVIFGEYKIMIFHEKDLKNCKWGIYFLVMCLPWFWFHFSGADHENHLMCHLTSELRADWFQGSHFGFRVWLNFILRYTIFLCCHSNTDFFGLLVTSNKTKIKLFGSDDVQHVRRHLKLVSNYLYTAFFDILYMPLKAMKTKAKTTKSKSQSVHG